MSSVTNCSPGGLGPPSSFNPKVASNNTVTIPANIDEALTKLTLSNPDFTLYIRENVKHVHQTILRASSAYFRALFDSGMSETRAKSVHLDILDPHAVLQVVDYMYGRPLQVDLVCMKPLLSVIEYFAYDELKETVIDALMDTLARDNCIDMYQRVASFAERYNWMIEVKYAAKEAIRMEFVDVGFSDGFLELPLGDVTAILQYVVGTKPHYVIRKGHVVKPKSPDVRPHMNPKSSDISHGSHPAHDMNYTTQGVSVTSQNTIPKTYDVSTNTKDVVKVRPDSALKASILWVNHDVKRRKTHFPVLAEIIDLNLCSYTYLKYVYKNFPHLKATIRPAYHAAQQSEDEPEDHIPMRQSILLCSGSLTRVTPLTGARLSDKLNTHVYEINVVTDDVQQVATLPAWCVTSPPPALCAIPQGIFGAESERQQPHHGATMAWLYNKYSRKVKVLPTLSVPIPYFSCAVFVDGKVYVIGGCDVHILDLKSETWTRGPTIPRHVEAPRVASVGHHIYVLHQMADSEMNYLQCLDTRSCSWRTDIPRCADVESFDHSTMVACGESLFITLYDTLYRYDTQAREWSKPASRGFVWGSLLFRSLHPVLIDTTITFWKAGMLNGKEKPVYEYDIEEAKWRRIKPIDEMSNLTDFFVTPI